eukprot:831081-Rhodomonas_salina.5
MGWAGARADAQQVPRHPRPHEHGQDQCAPLPPSSSPFSLVSRLSSLSRAHTSCSPFFLPLCLPGLVLVSLPLRRNSATNKAKRGEGRIREHEPGRRGGVWGGGGKRESEREEGRGGREGGAGAEDSAERRVCVCVCVKESQEGAERGCMCVCVREQGGETSVWSALSACSSTTSPSSRCEPAAPAPCPA